MSAPAEALPAPVAAPAVPADAALWTRIERGLSWAGDQLNPILVKETRQALKSKQFLITFSLLLVCAWVWTILAVALIGPDIYYAAQGADVFAGYYFLLAAAMFVIVPFGAYRSLASEQEDRTFSLLSITTLRPRQIVSGKLGSAMVQMIVYLSSITPCLAFTYMLRGIDLPSIVVILGYTVLASLGLSVIALLAATLTTEKHWQVVLSVVLIAGLLFAFGWLFAAAMAVLSEMEGMYHWNEFWIVNGGILSGYVSYFALFFFAAAAQLTFSTDNRATRLRIVMLAQQMIFTGWMAWLWISLMPHVSEEAVVVYLIVLGFHWYFMGALMTGESPELSPRVRRRLPQSFLGRVFLTWFNPGPGTGYVFALANMAAALVMGLGALAIVKWLAVGFRGGRPFRADLCFSAGMLVLCYLAFYLGLGLMLVRTLRRVTQVPMFLALLLHVLLLLLCTFVPLILQMMLLGSGPISYSPLHVLNPFWTVAEMVEGPWRGTPAFGYEVVVIMTLFAGIVFVLNLPSIVREVARVRIDRPRRVAEEDQAIEAAKAPPQPVHISPWD